MQSEKPGNLVHTHSRGRSSISSSYTNASSNPLKLDKVLSGETCSPISFYDFSSYLAYIEFSVENLQFWLWYDNYRKRYFKLSQTDQLLSPPPIAPASEVDPSLQPFREEINRVLFTFFDQSSSKELNVPSPTLLALKRNAVKSTHPDCFKDAADHVYDIMATHSLPKFLKNQVGTVHDNKAHFWMTTGTITVLLGIAIALILILVPKNINRGWRIFTLPLYWLGSGQVFAGTQKLAFCSHLFGRRNRQLQSWELLHSQYDDQSSLHTSDSFEYIPSVQELKLKGAPVDRLKNWLVGFGFASTPLPAAPKQTMFGNTAPVEDPLVRHLQNVAFFQVVVFASIFTACMLAWTLAVPSRK